LLGCSSPSADRARGPDARQPAHGIMRFMNRPASVLALALALSLAFSACARRVRVEYPRPGHVEEGVASYYDGEFVGRRTASGEVMDRNKMTAAHRTFAFGTVVKVFNEDNGLEAVVRINDRGPFVRGRIIDLTLTGARAIDMVTAGTARVRLEVLSGPPAGAPLWVQVGAFREPSNATRLADELASSSFAVQVVEHDGYHRVRLGPCDNERDAQLLASRARKHGLPAIIVVEE